MRFAAPILILLGSSVFVSDGVGGTFSAGQIEAFEKTIRPLLVERCMDCHGAHKHENGLRLDSREAILRGSDYGKVVVEGNPGASKLVQAVKGLAGVEKMPKKGAVMEFTHYKNMIERPFVVVFDCDVSKTLAVTFVASSPSISTIYELKGIEKDKPFYKWK